MTGRARIAPGRDAASGPTGIAPPRSFEWWDYGFTGAALGAYYFFDLGVDGPKRATWNSPWPLDEPARNLFVLETRAARERADLYSDAFWSVAVGYSVALPVIVAALSQRQVESPWQLVWRLELINLQSYAVASVLARAPHRLIGRSRPAAIGCAEDDQYSALCGSRAQLASFPGGHTTIASTGAGLACAHHIHGQLLGGASDSIACSIAVLSAGVVFVTRLQSDRHWLSDNLVGVASGVVSGYLLPTLLHYRPFWIERGASAQSDAELSQWGLFPLAPSAASGASVVGRF